MPSGQVHECDLPTSPPGHGKHAASTVLAEVMMPDGQSSHSPRAGLNTNCPGKVELSRVYRRYVPSGLHASSIKRSPRVINEPRRAHAIPTSQHILATRTTQHSGR
jgi:hypothetical protein